MFRPSPQWLRYLAWLGVAIWATTIFILSSLTPTQLDDVASIKIWDKLAHFSAFFAGSVNLTLALIWSTNWPWRRIAVTAAVAIAIFGATDEFHQLYTPNRSGADSYDWTADALGALSASLITTSIYARYFRSPHPTP